MENVFLIVGLGNPGAEYARTRHNAGFALVEKLAARWKADWKNERRFHARIARADIVAQASSLRTGGTRVPLRVILCQPQTFMNLSGEAVGALKNFYQLPLNRLLVAVDDADLPLGEIRLRARRQQRRASRAGVHRAASGHARVCAAPARHRPGGWRAGNHGLRARAFQRGRDGAAGKSFGPGGRPGGMLAGRRNGKGNEPV